MKRPQIYFLVLQKNLMVYLKEYMNKQEQKFKEIVEAYEQAKADC